MGGRVVLEFCSGEEFGPAMWSIGAKDSKVDFNLLVDAFSLAICLRMVSCG